MRPDSSLRIARPSEYAPEAGTSGNHHSSRSDERADHGATPVEFSNAGAECQFAMNEAIRYCPSNRRERLSGRVFDRREWIFAFYESRLSIPEDPQSATTQTAPSVAFLTVSTTVRNTRRNNRLRSENEPRDLHAGGFTETLEGGITTLRIYELEKV